jgi:hypothetical protein
VQLKGQEPLLEGAMDMRQPVSREELYKLVWSEPMTKVAERFDVSGSYMARVCAALNVPRPRRGHWAKLAVGKAPAAAPLPQGRPGDQAIWSPDQTLPAALEETVPRAPSQEGKAVRFSRSTVHGLIRGAKPHFENSRPVGDRLYLKPFKRLLPDIVASAECLEKALKLANDLFNALESVGHRVMIAPPNNQLGRTEIEERETSTPPRARYQHSGLWSPFRPTVTYVGEVAIGLAIVEMSEQVLLRYVGGKYVRDAEYTPPRSRHFSDRSWTTTRELPTGRLRVVAYSPYPRVSWSSAWQETKRSGLRSTIRAIVKAIEETAPALVVRLEQAEHEAEIAHQLWLEQQERRRREEDRRRVAESVRESEEHLAEVISQWSKATSIDTFLASVEARVQKLAGPAREAALGRLTLARQLLGDRDPLHFLLSWKTPDERYRPIYPSPDRSTPD